MPLVGPVGLVPFLVPSDPSERGPSEESAMLCRILSADLASSQPLSCQVLYVLGLLGTGFWKVHGISMENTNLLRFLRVRFLALQETKTSVSNLLGVLR